MEVVAGIDVGKTQLDVSVGSGAVQRFENSRAGITALVRCLKREGVTVAVCEPTGGYERQLVKRLHTALPMVEVAHPNKVRAFARACGKEAKTDRLDAQVLSRYGTVMDLEGTPAPSPERESLQEALQRRQQLVEQRVQERNRLDKGLSAASQHSITRHIHWLDKEIERLDQQYQATVQGSQELRQRAQLLSSMRGVGDLTAAILTAFLPELGQLPGKALTALAGLGTAGSSAAIALSAAVGAWCAAPSTSPPCPRSARTTAYSASTKACASAASRARSPWWPSCARCSCNSMPSSGAVRPGKNSLQKQPDFT
jgi:transposase